MGQSKTLTAKQARFVSEYLIDNNGTQAVVRAGYSKNNASQKAHNLLLEPHIKQALIDGQVAIAKRNELTIDDILDELEEARKIAQAEGKGAPMVAASMGKAKLLGLIVDKAETKTEGNVNINIKFK